ncbi:MAG: imidazole glycerol phosphate synthase subunit HisH [Endomicrobia bacterium]|nr:imidazole glycerol phosphate synthase subunit HisH [Endomicrobiia bacterium]
MIKNVGIINYGAGNLMSISKAVNVLGLNVKIVSTGGINRYDLIILPGVGNFGSAVENLRKTGLFEEIKNFYFSGKPILGICLGIQLIFKNSEEAKNVEGLGLIGGKVAKFQLDYLPVPHMCWNIVEFKHENKILLEKIKNKEYFYFVHSYYPVLEDKRVIFGVTDYGCKFCSMIVKDNLVATQFHLEKSGTKGLKLLSNIIRYFSKQL